MKSVVRKWGTSCLWSWISMVVFGILVAGIPVGSVSAQPAKKTARSGASIRPIDLNRSIDDLRSLDLDELSADRSLRLAGVPDLARLKAWYETRARMAGVSPTVSGRMVAAKSSDATFAAMQELAVPVEGNDYAYPALATLPNGDILMAFKDWGVFPEFWDGPPTDPAKIYLVKSSNGGVSWGPAVKIAEGDFPLDFNFLEITRLGSGRLLLNDLTPFEPDHYYISDDDGDTWTSTAITERLNPEWHGPIDGNVWYSYETDTGRDAVYRSSSDGITWTAAKVIVDNINPDRYDLAVEAVGSAGGSNVIAFVRQLDWDTYESSTLVARSADGGTTWSSPAAFPTGDYEMSLTGIERDADGRLWLVGQASPPCCEPTGNPFEYAGDIYYLTSDDDGQTWSSPTRFTSYYGDDYLADITLSTDGPLVAFTSQRVAPGGIAFGIAGLTPDGSAPPAARNWVLPWEGLGAGETFPFVAAAGSEAGIASVDVIVSVDGIDSIIPLTGQVGGCPDFNLADGFCWHADIGPFDLGSDVALTTMAMDNNGRTGTSWTDFISVIAVHNVGAVTMPVQPNGSINSLRWGPEGDQYMCCGGLWAGTSLNGGTVVEEWMWVPKDGFTPTQEAGDSDRDITVAYSDDGSLGLDVVQRSYQWSDGARSNGIVIEYEYTNNGSVGNIASMYTALNLDVDIANGWWADDLIAYSTDSRVIYMYDSGLDCSNPDFGISCPEGYVGIAVIADAAGSTGSTVTPHTATWNFYDKEPFQVMREGINPALTSGTPVEGNDYRMMLTAMPFALAPGASQKVAFALVMGTSPTELATNVDALADAYATYVTSIEHVVGDEIPSEFRLEQNFPNPFNPSTTFSFSLPQASKATLTVHNVLGQEVATLLAGDLAAGVHDVRWDATGLPSGVYLYRLEADGYTASKRMILLK